VLQDVKHRLRDDDLRRVTKRPPRPPERRTCLRGSLCASAEHGNNKIKGEAAGACKGEAAGARKAALKRTPCHPTTYCDLPTTVIFRPLFAIDPLTVNPPPDLFCWESTHKRWCCAANGTSEQGDASRINRICRQREVSRMWWICVHNGVSNGGCADGRANAAYFFLVARPFGLNCSF